MEAILDFAQRLYRIAQQAETERFQDLALAALGEHLRFEAALWLTGQLHAGQLQVHRMHAYRMPLAALEELIALMRQHPDALEVTAAAPGCAHVFEAAELYARPAGQAALAQVRRWRIERQLLIATTACGLPGGQWLSLHRPQSDAPFEAGERAALRLLMPHLAESRAVNRALCLRRASSEPLIAPGPHRALTLPDGTVLHCGRLVSEAIGATWPQWSGLRLPPPLLGRVLREEAVPLAGRGETLRARRFSDSLVLSIHSVPVRERLTRREYQVMQLHAAGSDCRAIARRCALAPGTVRNIVRLSYRKLGINSRAQLLRLLARASGDA